MVYVLRFWCYGCLGILEGAGMVDKFGKYRRLKFLALNDWKSKEKMKLQQNVQYRCYSYNVIKLFSQQSNDNFLAGSNSIILHIILKIWLQTTLEK